MLFNTKDINLVFPTLIDGAQKTDDVVIYHLAWSNNDKLQNGKTALPKPYLDMITQLKYAIPPDYLKEIRRATEMADREWNRDPGYFDTNVRDWLSDPAIAYVQLAFKLIDDCSWDVEKQSYHHGPHYTSRAMMYRFWSMQTGSGLYDGNCDFDYLRKRQEMIELGIFGGGNKDIRKFLDEVKQFEKEKKQ